jgi:ferritin-like metal-binding protein YciE
MNVDSFRKLWVHELKDLYNAENQLLKALPKMSKKATSPDLKAAFDDHLEETRGQIARLETIFKSLDYGPRGEKCAAMEGLIEEAEDVFETVEDPDVMDAALIAAAQRVEHYEIAGYGTARAFAEQLGETEAERLLKLTLDEESLANHKLNELAKNKINLQAQT